MPTDLVLYFRLLFFSPKGRQCFFLCCAYILMPSLPIKPRSSVLLGLSPKLVTTFLTMLSPDYNDIVICQSLVLPLSSILQICIYPEDQLLGIRT